MKRVDLIKYTVTAPQLDGELIYGYDVDEILREFENKAVMTPEILQFFGTKLPLREAWLVPMLRQFKQNFGIKLEVQRMDIDLSFPTFWDYYNYKVGNKQRAKDLWIGKKPTNTRQYITEADKLKSFRLVPKLRYNYKLKNKDLPYLETFLYQRRFENEF
ncbi:MAG: hypothetical protein U9N85_01205 [Bacteroidota bacterium]|nr:hypothetical protein [Bacteroidota bacterium]